jgi:hypothetical protein
MASGNGSTMKLCKNGVQIGSDAAYTEPVGAVPANMYIGSNASGAYQADGIISDLRIGKYRTLAQHLADYNLGIPLPIDNDTTLKMYFADNIYYSYIVTIDEAANCIDMDWTGALNYPTLAAAGTNAINLYGSLKFISNMNVTYNYIIYLKSSTTSTINTSGIITPCDISVAQDGGEWTLQSDINLSNGIFYLNYGTLNTNNYNVICSDFNGTDVFYDYPRALNLGSSIITCSGSWVFTNVVYLTFDAGTSTIKLTGNTTAFNGGGLTYNNVEFQGTLITVTDSNTFNDLKLTEGKTIYFESGETQTLTTLTGNGTLGNLINIAASSATAFIISIASGTILKTYYSIENCTATGGATFKARGSEDLGGNTGWSISNIFVKNGGVWKLCVDHFVNIGGTWKTIDLISTNIGGTWKSS